MFKPALFAQALILITLPLHSANAVEPASIFGKKLVLNGADGNPVRVIGIDKNGNTRTLLPTGLKESDDLMYGKFEIHDGNLIFKSGVPRGKSASGFALQAEESKKSADRNEQEVGIAFGRAAKNGIPHRLGPDGLVAVLPDELKALGQTYFKSHPFTPIAKARFRKLQAQGVAFQKFAGGIRIVKATSTKVPAGTPPNSQNAAEIIASLHPGAVVRCDAGGNGADIVDHAVQAQLTANSLEHKLYLEAQGKYVVLVQDLSKKTTGEKGVTCFHAIQGDTLYSYEVESLTAPAQSDATAGSAQSDTPKNP
jgi:hypothetical protein